jgi:trehalose utilization protein
MIINNMVRLAIAAACLATIATAPQAPAQTAARTVVVKHPRVVSQGDVSES